MIAMFFSSENVSFLLKNAYEDHVLVVSDKSLLSPKLVSGKYYSVQNVSVKNVTWSKMCLWKKLLGPKCISGTCYWFQNMKNYTLLVTFSTEIFWSLTRLGTSRNCALTCFED